MSKWIGFTIIALLLGGCVKFERQTMVYRHDTERDELRMLMIYEGIYGSGREERDRKELLSVLLRPRTFFFSNWLLEYARDQWIELADDLAEDENPEISELGQRMSRLVLDNVRVDNGTFYFNHKTNCPRTSS